jgi:hypothetical protein
MEGLHSLRGCTHAASGSHMWSGRWRSGPNLPGRSVASGEEDFSRDWGYARCRRLGQSAQCATQPLSMAGVDMLLDWQEA